MRRGRVTLIVLAALASSVDAARIKGIAPGCAGTGSEVAVTTRALRKGTVSVGGVPATVLGRTRDGFTFVVPGGLPTGPAAVVVARKRRSAEIGFVIEGVETCNGADDDCDGVVDDSVPEVVGPSGTQRCVNGAWRFTGRPRDTGGENTLCLPEDVEACWDGGAETRGRGICRDGIRSCTIDRVFGPCEGQVLPMPEDPGNGIDENCDGRDAPGGGELCVPGEMRSCYDGPPSTRDVGICRPGIRTCSAMGLFGLCDDQVLPQAEVPGNETDENCDGLDTPVVPALELTVNRTLSPTFQTSQVITGVVGSVKVEPEEPPDPFTATITPTSGVQGQQVEVTIVSAGATFEPGLVQVVAGTGVGVTAVEVTGTNTAIAHLEVAPDASLGPRLLSVQNGARETFATPAFAVVAAMGTISGRVTDADGNPIEGAEVCLSGTNICTTTNADGEWSLPGVPTTGTRVVINAPGFQEVSVPIGPRSATQASANLGSFAFARQQELPPPAPEPGAPPLDPAVASVLARSQTTIPEALTAAEATKVIVDTILLIGGDELGVLDDAGMQMNPNVTGTGMASVPVTGVESLARSLIQGQGTTLEQLAFALLLAGQWQGTPPTIDEYIAALQAQVDAAWADPDKETSALSIVVFNGGPSFRRYAPQLSRQTRISQFHAFLFLTGALIQSYETQNPSGGGGGGGQLAARGDILGDGTLLMLAQAADPPPVRSFRQFTRALPQLQTIMLGFIQNIIGSLLFTLPVAAAFGGPPALVLLTTVVGAISDFFLFAVIGAQLQAKAAPLPPSIESVMQVGNQIRIQIGRTSRDTPGFVSQAGPQLGTFYYTLYRGCPGQRSTMVRSNIRVTTYERDRPLGVFEVLDRTPEPGLNCYYADVLQLTGIDIPPNLNFVAGTMAIPTKIGIPIGNILSLFFVSDLISDFSVPSPIPAPLQPGAKNGPPVTEEMLAKTSTVFVPAPIVQTSVDTIRAGADRSYYVSDQPAKQLRKVDPTGATSVFAATNFNGPQVGLAIDREDNLYTENGGTEAKFGGRCFVFEQPSAARGFVGTIDKYSPLLDRGNTVSVAAMAIGPGIPGAVREARGDLYAAENFSRSIKRLVTSIIPPAGINALPAPGHGIFGSSVASPIVGNHYLALPQCDQSTVVDIDFDSNQDLYVLTSSNVGKYAYNAEKNAAGESTPIADFTCSGTNAADLELVGPERVVRNGRITLRASGRPCGGVYDWSIDGDAVESEGQHDNVGGSSLRLRGVKAGTATVSVVFRGDQGQVARVHEIEVLPGPFVMVHGITDSAAGFEPLKQHFIDLFGAEAFGGELCAPGAFHPRQKRQTCETAKTGAFYTLNFHDNQGNYRLQGAELADVIRQVREVNDADKVVVIAHSMGGLASRSYIQGISGVPYAGDVEHLVTLNTPHQGSETCDLLQIPGFTELVETFQAVIGLRPLPATLVGLLPVAEGLGTFTREYLPTHEPGSAAVQNMRLNSGTLRQLNVQTQFPADVKLTAVVSSMPGDVAANLCGFVGIQGEGTVYFYDDVNGQPASIDLCQFFAEGDLVVTQFSQDATLIVPHATKRLRTNFHSNVPPFVIADFEVVDQIVGVTGP